MMIPLLSISLSCVGGALVGGIAYAFIIGETLNQLRDKITAYREQNRILADELNSIRAQRSEAVAKGNRARAQNRFTAAAPKAAELREGVAG
ncbi:MAG: hypothetical protein ACSLE1_03060 [Sphingobium sp.]